MRFQTVPLKHMEISAAKTKRRKNGVDGIANDVQGKIEENG